MRDIKFRAWDYSKKKFVDPILTNVNLSHLFELKFYDYQQFTALKDKNGKEIYEGDLLSTNVNYNGHKAKYIVCFVAASFRLLRYYKSHNPLDGDLKNLQWVIDNNVSAADLDEPFGIWISLSTVLIEDKEKLTVIGNIHQNPELLENI